MAYANHPDRRMFVRKLSLALMGLPVLDGLSDVISRALLGAPASKFKLGLITDEVSADLEVAIQFLESFSLRWVELRNLWNNTYVTEAPVAYIDRAKKLLSRHRMQVSAIDTAFYKALLPGTKSEFTTDPHSARPISFEEQMALLDRGIQRAKTFGTRYLRIFSFYRVADPSAVYDQVVEHLKKAVKVAEKADITLLLENEHTCNVATAGEAARILKDLPSANLALNWDPGNAFAAGETPYPDGYDLLDKKRIRHLHLKDAQRNTETGKVAWLPVGRGQIDYLGQFRALLKDGYDGTLSLETHYKNKANNKEESSRESMAGILATIKKA
ncbi:MAG: sugar phosphate isomerase/epimerase [Acidobacteria bacterium]|nr:sugar phosphate isomerase/epimerase [Acidobacteriota bacterium]